MSGGNGNHTAASAVMPESVARPDTAGRWRLEYVRGLDGIRGVGMAFMLAYHSELMWAKGAFLALSQFFTLSGFLVMVILLRESDDTGRIDLARFWKRRGRRLMPAAFLALGGIVLYGEFVADPSQAGVIPSHVSAATLYVANWAFVFADTGYETLYASPSPVQHFWSLSVEEQFYILLPLTVLAIRRFTPSLKVLTFVVGGAALASAVWTMHLFRADSFERVYYGTDTRATEMLVGALLAIFVTRTGLRFSPSVKRLLMAVGTAAYAGSVLLFFSVPIDNQRVWSGGIALFSVATALVILALLLGARPLRVLDWEPIAWTGRLCYGLYLYHFPLFLWISAERTGLEPWPLFGVRVAATFAVAIPSYYLIESPVRKGWSFGFAPTLRPAAYGTGALMMIAAVFVIVERPAETQVLYSETQAAMPTAGDDPVLDVMMIVDDSGVAVARQIEEIASTDDTLSVISAPLPACDRLVERGSGQICQSWVDAWEPLIDRVDPDVVLMYVDRLPEGAVDLDATDGAVAPMPQVLNAALDVLTGRGSPVVWTRTGTDWTEALRRREDPFNLAMAAMVLTRYELREIDTLQFTPDPAADPAFVDESTETILERLRLVAREGDGGRVLMVGDSQAQSVAVGLETWSATNDGPTFWNAAKAGCSVIQPPLRLSMDWEREEPANAACAAAVAKWGDNVSTFDPDLVIVLSSLRDLQAVRLEGWDDFATVGDPAFDDYLLDTYIEAYDVLSSEGAAVTWMLAPCQEFYDPLTDSRENPPDAFAPERLVYLREVVLPRLAEARPAVELYDLGAVLCPGGQFLESVPGVGPVRPDGIHLTKESTLWLAEEIAPELFAELGG